MPSLKKYLNELKNINIPELVEKSICRIKSLQVLIFECMEVGIPLAIYAVCTLACGFVLNIVLQNSIILSSWCDWLISHLVYVLVFFNIGGFISFFFAVSSFHKDTSLLHILSIIISQIAINLLSESSANLALILSLQIFIIFAYVRIRNYLREIKYYS